jgi:hypothetical protein|tara:strand:- start:225 stop:383 length:159 start_codon:yes stop_codon:yes gene_type:complete
MAQAQAMTQAAHAVFDKEQDFELVPVQIRGVCESAILRCRADARWLQSGDMS